MGSMSVVQVITELIEMGLTIGFLLHTSSPFDLQL